MVLDVMKRGANRKLSKNFNSSEFECKCSYKDCTFLQVSADLVYLLQKLRNKMKRPFNINSAHRCEKHNKKIGGSPRSQHRWGCAADISIKGWSKEEVEKFDELLKDHEGGLGLYNTFRHVDVRGKRARWDLRKKG